MTVETNWVIDAGVISIFAAVHHPCMETDMVRDSTNQNARSTRLIFLPIFIGLVTSQIISTLFVYLSNSRIHLTAAVINDAGLLAIPTGPVMATLKNFGTAIGGGVFFTLSIGIGLTLVSWAAVRSWDFLFKRHRWVLAGYGVVWLGLLVTVNLRGLVLFPTLYCVLVPATTALTTAWELRFRQPIKPIIWFTPIVTLIVLTGLWSTQLNSHIFGTIRDHILLSNPVGRTVNDFYYRYTLYAAEAFKSFDQKSIRTGHLEGVADERQRQRFKAFLAKHDVLILEKIKGPDVIFHYSTNHIALTSTDKRTVQTSIRQFMSAPRTWLGHYSEAIDRLAFFRKMSLVGLLLGFPILLFIIVYGILRTAVGCLADEQPTVWLSSALCMIIGVALFLPMLGARPLPITDEGVNQALSSQQWTHHVAALRHIERHKLEITRYPNFSAPLSGAMVVERYWLARALAGSRAAETYPLLLGLLNDPHPNVICQTLYALGERGERRAIQPIKDKLTGINHWYAQWYGYRALRRLGWYQVPSN